MITAFALTTVDNKFDYFDEFDQWNRFDTDFGYYSSAYLARIANTTDDMSDQQYWAEVERAIDEIIEENRKIGNYIYKKVSREIDETETL